MSLVSLLSIILVAQLPSHTFGKSLTSIDAGSAVIPNSEIARLVENPRLRVESYDESRTRRNSKLNDGDDDDILINKLSREYVTSNLFDSATACNNWNGDLESDLAIEKRLKNVGCFEDCRQKVLARLRCAEDPSRFLQKGRQSLPISEDILRRRRSHRAPPQIKEKKAKLSVSTDNVYLPHRDSRGLSRKHFQRFEPIARKRNNVELNSGDYSTPNREKRQKVIIPKAYTPFEKRPSDPWVFQNINSNDRSMIDWQRDLNQLGHEANKDITAPATTLMNEKLSPHWSNGRMLDKTTMIFGPLSDDFLERLETSEAPNLISPNTPNNDERSSRFTSRFI